MARPPSRTPPSTVEERLRAAQEAERAATERVQQASRARLAELLRLPPRERLAYLDDPALVGPDRVNLRRSLQANLTRPRRRWRPGGRLQGSCPSMRWKFGVELERPSVRRPEVELL